MIDPGGKFEDALNREIDGETTSEESAELRRHLAQSPEAQSYFEDLEGLCRMLRAVKEIEPPVGFKEGIVQLVHSRAGNPTREAARETRKVPGESWLGAVRGALGRRLRFQGGYAFAAGIAAGVLLFVVFTDSFTSIFRLDESSLPGTMLPIEQSREFETVDTSELRSEDIQATVETRRDQDLLLTEIQVHSRQPVQIWVEFDGAILTPLGFEQGTDSPGRIRLDTGLIHIAHEGPNTYRFLLRDIGGVDSQLGVRVGAGAEVVERRLLTR